MPRACYHDNTQQFEQRVVEIIKDNLIDSAYIKAEDVNNIAFVELGSQLTSQELHDIQATRKL